ncbi:MAG: hypothetical protein NVS3B3_21470 [Aquirhabdus sp.]
MDIHKYLPTLPEVIKEGIIVVASTLIAAWIISKIPHAKKLVDGSKITINDSNGKVIF